MPNRDFEEYVAQARRDWRACKEARDAVRARAAGMSRDQLKDLYRAELRARDLDVPSEVILDADVSLMTADYVSAARAFGQVAGGIAKLLGGMVRPPR
jgi:hypothetical protein